MKWTRPTYGDFRTIKKFAILPIEAEHEVRWLEMVKIYQVWRGYWANVVFKN